METLASISRKHPIQSIHADTSEQVETIAQYTNESQVDNGKVATNQFKFRRTIYIMLLRCQYNMSTKKEFFEDMSYVADRHRFVLVMPDRYTDMLRTIRGCTTNGRSGADDTVWMQRRNLLRKITPQDRDILLHNQYCHLQKIRIAVPG